MLDKFIEQLPQTLQSHASSVWKQFQQVTDHLEKKPEISLEQQQQILKTMICSDYVSQQIFRTPEMFFNCWNDNIFYQQRKAFELSEELAELLVNVKNESQLAQVLRQFRNREMVRISFRDINGLADIDEILNDLSGLADSCIAQTLEWIDCLQQKEFGSPVDHSGDVQQLVVIGMGKLGACELNFSSDIDLIFAFPEHGETINGPRSISNNEYFIKLGQRLIKALDQKTADGFVFRVDMRLRPFGNSGPLAITFDALENYYATHGREWERYALIKARSITGRTEDKNYLRKMLTPFVFRRYIDFSVFEALREMKSMIAHEVKQKKKERNVKLGAGGIREIEFLAQAFQLLRGGRDIKLQERQVQKVISYLAAQQLLPENVKIELLQAYRFLRTTEHRIQQLADQQTHDLPNNDFPQARIAYGMGYDDWGGFALVIDKIRHTVEYHFQQLFENRQADSNNTVQDEVNAIWQAKLGENRSMEVLTQLGYKQSQLVIQLLAGFRDSHSYRKMAKQGRERLDKLMPLLLMEVVQVDDSETALKRLLDVLESICRRSVYLSLLIENPLGLSQLVKLCAASSWISRQLARHPALLDELLDARVLYSPLDKQQLYDELKQKIELIPENDLEQRMDFLRHFKQSHALRVAAADVAGLIPIMKVSDYLTWLAEVILHFVVETAWLDISTRFGEPQGDINDESDRGFGILGYGKLGGIELGYSSDLDMVFVFSSQQAGYSTNGEKSIDNLQFYSKLSLRIMHILNTQMHSGILYEADMRLRPNGNSGLITTHLNAFRDYQLKQAWTWEHQALVRARLIVGDISMAEQFLQIRQEVLSQQRDEAVLKKEVREMRSKMRLALAKKKKNHFDIKQGLGGIADIEFIVQFLVLNNARQFPRLLEWTDNIRIMESLTEADILPQATAMELSEAYRQYRNRLHQLSLQEVPGLVADSEFTHERAMVNKNWKKIMDE